MKDYVKRVLVLVLVCALLPLMAYGESRSSQLKELGNKYRYENNYVMALRYTVEALREAEKEGNEQVITECYNNIGCIYAIFKNYDEALSYFDKAYARAKRADDGRMIWICAVNYISTLTDRSVGNDNIAAAHNLQSYLDDISKNANDDEYLQYFYENMATGLIYMSQNKEQEAIDTFKRLLGAVNAKKGDATEVWGCIGRCYQKAGNGEKALEAYMSAINTAKRVNSLDCIDVLYKSVADIYMEQELQDSVVKYQKLYINANDSLFNGKLFSMERAKLSNLEDSLIEKKIGSLKSWIWMLLSALILILSLFVLACYYFRQLRQAQRFLIRKNEQLMSQVAVTKSITAYDVVRDEAETNADMANDKASLPINESQAQALLQAIDAIMNDIDVISNPDFSLAVLAKNVQSNTKYVSNLINAAYGKSFKALLNEIRIREASKRLGNIEEYGGLTISAIAQMVGYNSMANFIMFFKRYVGVTPSKYRQLKANGDNVDSAEY